MDENYLKNETELPEKLGKENIEKSISGVKQKKSAGRIVLRTVTAVVLAVAVAAGSVFSLRMIKSRRVFFADPEQKLAAAPADYPGDIVTFSDYDGIMKIFRARALSYAYGDIRRTGKSYMPLFAKEYTAADDEAAGISAAAKSSETRTAPADNAPAQHSETNLRDENADEADVVKTDGRYVYVLSSEDKTDGYEWERDSVVRIADAGSPGNVTSVSCVSAYTPKDGFTAEINDFYLSGGKLVVIESIREKYDYGFYGRTAGSDDETGTTDNIVFKETAECWADDQYTAAVIYDVADPSAPLLENYIAQKGYYVDSRITGGRIILISNDYVDTYSVWNGDLDGCVCIPSVVTKEGEKYLPPENIIAADTEEESYLNITSADLQDSSAEPSSLSILGGGSDVYCTADTLYVAKQNYSWSNAKSFDLPGGERKYSSWTKIFRFGISDGSLVYTGGGDIPGTTEGSFSMDEYGGYFRIAVSTQLQNNGEFSQGSAVFVLDGDFNITGAIPELKAGESVYGVRFSGDTAYVVTFYQTDPLFVLDMSDPAAPRETGKLEMPGFSDYLHPVGDGLLAGVGSDGDENGTNGGTKLSLFDVSDPKNPVEKGKIAIADSWLYNFSSRAFLAGPGGLYGYPVCVYRENTDGAYSYSETLGIQTFTVKDGELEASGFYKAANSDCGYLAFVRGVVIGEYVLVVSDLGIAVYEAGNTAAPVSILTF